jgi:hypothetical protein
MASSDRFVAVGEVKIYSNTWCPIKILHTCINHLVSVTKLRVIGHLVSVTKLHVFNHLASVAKPQVFYYLMSDAKIFDIHM